MDRGIRPGRAVAPLLFLATLAALVLPALASAHIERPSYWPDPAPDTSVSPAAGGTFPKAKPLSSALRGSASETHVVCQKKSLSRAKKSINRAVENGYSYRPSDPKSMSRRLGDRLIEINRELRERCRYKHIQDAVNAAGNNDRVVIMPGLYTEPKSRAKPTFDPACDRYEINTEFGDPGALSYAYQFHCPNDQNLIAVMGRTPGTGQDPDPPRWDRHGIPNLGRCIRCNLQIEGSGVTGNDVIIEAGRAESGNGAPANPVKDVGIRADRADGFVLRNVNVRHAKEHGIYVLESDGYLLDRFKAYYNGLYGTLVFVEDHGIQQHCETVGHADSGIYPGAPVETGEQRPPGTNFRYNQIVRYCDSRHNLAGYSATNGNAVRVHDNEFYDNALGVQTDVVTSAGHPGFPGDSQLFEHNNIYSNNFNVYAPDSDVKPAFPFPVGTGLWIAGGNHHIVRNNNIYDNWRRGTMVFAVPDSLVCGEHTGNRQAGCDPNQFSTSHFNRHHSNVMGLAPNGRALINGTDFWWDDFPDTRGNCWYLNTGPRPITFSPRQLPSCDEGRNPEESVGQGNPANEGELLSCAVAFETRNFDSDTSPCPWLRPPPRPSSDASRREAIERRDDERMRKVFLDFCRKNPSSGTCKPYARRGR